MTKTDITDHEDEDEAPAPVPVFNISIEPMPFTEVESTEPDRLLRKWLIKEIHQPDTPMTQGTVDHLERLFQWVQNGIPEPKIKAVK